MARYELDGGSNTGVGSNFPIVFDGHERSQGMKRETITLTYHDGHEEQFECETFAGSTPIIVEPGKFEAEPLYTPFFYAVGLDGCPDEVGEGWEAFKIEANDLQQFPDLVADEYVILRCTDQGFVDSEVMTRAELDKFMAEQEQEEGAEDR